MGRNTTAVVCNLGGQGMAQGSRPEAASCVVQSL